MSLSEGPTGSVGTAPPGDAPGNVQGAGVQGAGAFWRDRDPAADTAPFLLSAGKSLSFAEVFALGDGLWRGLPAGTAAILCRKDVATVAAYLGALRNAVVPLMLDAEMPGPALARTLTAHRPDYILGVAGGAPAASSAVPSVVLPAGYAPVALASPGFAGRTLYRAEMADGVSPHPDLALMLPTSGSTGDPKCVRIGHGALSACTRAICAYLEMSPARRAVSLLPLHYSYGLSVLNVMAQCRGSFVLSEMSVLDKGFWPLIEETGVTDFSGVPFIFETLRRMRFSERTLQTLCCVTQAGGRLEPKLTRHFHQLFSAAGIRYFTMYGQTEASPRIAYLPPERAVEKEGSVGIPIACGQAVIADTGARTGEGELLYRGDNVCLGYAHARADIALGDVFQGELATGDQVRIDPDGFIFIVGRRKRFIKMQGISVNLDHVESVLSEQGIACRVVGRDNRILVCHTGAGDAAEELPALVRQSFGFHGSGVRYAELPELPVTGSGKPDYAALTELLG